MRQRNNVFVFLLLIRSVLSWTTVDNNCNNNNNNNNNMQRRNVLEQIFCVGVAATTSFPSLAAAADGGESVFKRETNNFAYSITTPATFSENSKPMKTHLDEINFVSEGVKGYQYGITVDPVRINSLKEVRGFYVVCLFLLSQPPRPPGGNICWKLDSS
jgi:hypothetical protein